MSKRRLLFDLGSLGASNALGKLLWSVSLMIMMRILGPDDYGTLVVIWSIAGLMAPLTDMGLSQLLLREGTRQPAIIPHLLRRSLLARATLGGVSIIAVTAIVESGVGPVVTIGAGLIALIAAAPFLDGAFLTMTALAQSERRIGLLSVWRIASFALLPLLLLALHGALPGLTASAIAYLLASAVGMIGFFAMRGRMPPVAAPAASWRTTLAQARPFLFMSIAALSYGRAEVAAVGLFGTTVDAAFYHAGYQVILLVFSLSDVVFTAAFAGLYRANADRETLARCWPPLLRALLVMMVLSLPPLWWYADDVMTLLGGEDFAAAGPVLRALLPMVAMLPLAASLNFLMLLDRPDKRAAIDTACVLATVVLVLLLSASGSVVHAAMAASACYAVACAVAWFLVARLGLRLPWVKDAARAVLVALAASTLLMLDWPSWWLGAIAYVGVAAALLYAFRYLRLDDLRELAA